ncbi:GNAT family N-acetyltransferase [Myxococcus hansupus]|nr:GNAT family N-acetyltransferase [Myxococcus hansupus]
METPYSGGMGIQPRVTEAGPRDVALHASFCDYVSHVFTRADFRRWTAWGEWDDGYRAFMVVEGGRVVANASVTRMRLLLDGREVSGFQLGAVGCLPSGRGRGLARTVMDAALAYCGEAPVLLFANPSVRAFYPRFGFQARGQTLFAASHVAKPAGPAAPLLDVSLAEVRAGLARLADAGVPVTERFGARGHSRIASWYAANGFARPLRQLRDDAWVFAEVEGETLYVDDIFAREPFDLSAELPRLIDRPITSIQFGFTPERWWPGAEPVGEEADADLFVRGGGWPEGFERFPVMART